MAPRQPLIQLRAPALADEGEFLARVRASRGLHRPWLRPPASAEAFRRYLEAAARPNQASFLVCRSSGGEIAGVIDITNIVRGLFQSGYLGYYAFAGFERQGLMRAGLGAVVREAFGPLRLHRLEANIQPDNLASIALVRACGFTREGYSPKYLEIGGQWRDHERWARVKG